LTHEDENTLLSTWSSVARQGGQKREKKREEKKTIDWKKRKERGTPHRPGISLQTTTTSYIKYIDLRGGAGGRGGGEKKKGGRKLPRGEEKRKKKIEETRLERWGHMFNPLFSHLMTG